jgi:hypothetical protein
MQLTSAALQLIQISATIWFVVFEFKRWGICRVLKKPFFLMTVLLALCVVTSGVLAIAQFHSEDINNRVFLAALFFGLAVGLCHSALLFMRTLPLMESARDSENTMTAMVVVLLLNTIASIVTIVTLKTGDSTTFQCALLIHGILLVGIDLYCTNAFYARYKADKETLKNQPNIQSLEISRIISTHGLATCASSLFATICEFAGYLIFANMDSTNFDIGLLYIMYLGVESSQVVTSIIWMTMKIRLDSLGKKRRVSESKTNALQKQTSDTNNTSTTNLLQKQTSSDDIAPDEYSRMDEL